MKQYLSILSVCFLFFPATLMADMQSEIRQVLQDRLLHRATTGVLVMRLGKTPQDSQKIYSLESAAPLIPASNLKLATTSASVDALGPDFKFKTQLVKVGDDLAIIGDGDPSFGDAEFLKRAGWNTTTVFDSWAQQLKKLNVQTVANVVVDDSIFEEPSAHPNWPARQLDQRYAAEIAGLNLNANCVDFIINPGPAGKLATLIENPPTKYLKVSNTCINSTENDVVLSRAAGTNDVVVSGHAPSRGTVQVSLTVHDPSLFAATVFRESLESAGIKVTGDVHRDRTLRARHDAGTLNWTPLAVNDTALSIVMARANKDSMNLYAECLCKRLGAQTSHQSGSWTNGTAAVGAFLAKAGVSPAQYHLDDGCGLSKQNNISPEALCKVLEYDFFSENHQAFCSSLAVAGVDGTLDDRFRGSDIRGRLFGKSGFVEGVSCLSGYLHGRDGAWYAFSIMMNGIPHLSNSEIKPLQEKIIKAVDNLAPALSTRR